MTDAQGLRPTFTAALQSGRFCSALTPLRRKGAPSALPPAFQMNRTLLVLRIIHLRQGALLAVAPHALASTGCARVESCARGVLGLPTVRRVERARSATPPGAAPPPWPCAQSCARTPGADRHSAAPWPPFAALPESAARVAPCAVV
eukprot:scaffold201_cov405-Prasinococcus_capsulatus_cf.AAC.54